MNSIWIARDKDGTLCAYNQKPCRIAFDDIWLPENGNDWNYEVLNDDWFPEVTWNDEPIKLVIKEKAIDALDTVLDNWVHGGDEDCIIAEFERELNKEKEDWP